MKIGLIVVGDEILSGDRKDLNAEFFIHALRSKKLFLDFLVFVRDIQDDIEAAFNLLVENTRYLFISGGLGLTPDDITLESLAKATGFMLIENPRKRDIVLENLSRLKATRYYGYVNELSKSLENSEPIPNPVGVAAGERFNCKGCDVFVLPGVPKEFQEMIIAYVLNMLPEGSEEISSEYLVDSKEAFLIETLRQIGKEFQVETFSYPPILSEKYLRIRLRGVDPDRLEKACVFFENFLRDLAVYYEKRKS